MTDRDDSTFFFLHVMKTAGSTFGQHLRRNFAVHEMYPRGDGSSGPGAYFQIAMLAALTEEERARVRLFRGHFPYAAAAAYGAPDQTVITILREPVARTVSLLTREQAIRQPGRPLEDIYSDFLYYKRFVHNHMTKVFSMQLEDGPLAFFSPVPVNRQRLLDAKQNLERIDLIGFQDSLSDLIDEVRSRFGWRIEPVEDQKVSRGVEVSESFRERIALDNALDIELYQFARELTGRPSGQ